MKVEEKAFQAQKMNLIFISGDVGWPPLLCDFKSN